MEKEIENSLFPDDPAEMQKLEELAEVQQYLVSLEEFTRLFSSCTRVGNVDKEKTIELFSAAKGERSLRSFADALDVNVSTVSRIINGQTEEINPKLLAKIMAHAAEGSGVTAEELMSAQGLVKDLKKYKESGRNETKSRMIISDILLRNGFTIRYADKEETAVINLGDFWLRTNALGKDEALWVYKCQFQAQDKEFLAVFKPWINRVMSFFYLGGKADRISFLTDNPYHYNAAKKYMSTLTLQDEVSLICYSTFFGVREEFVAPLKGDKEPKFVFESADEEGSINDF